MKIYFWELPEPLRAGGLEAACRGLGAALKEAGHEVSVNQLPAWGDEEAVVHFHGLWSPLFYRVFQQCRRNNIPTLSSPHGMLEPWAWRTKRWKKWPYFLLLEKRRLVRSNCVLATAEQEAERLRKRLGAAADVRVLPLGSNLQVTPDYADARKELQLPPKERVLLYLSRIHPKKGLLELIQALGQMDHETLVNTRLIIVGDGPETYVGQCKRAAEQLEGKVAVDWKGPIWGDEKWRFLQAADLMCLTTYSENFGLIVLEATQVGTPVLTTLETPWGVLGEEQFGLVVEPGVANYQKALKDFLQNWQWTPERRSQLANWTQQHFDWSNLVCDYVDLYAELVDRAQSGLIGTQRTLTS